MTEREISDMILTRVNDLNAAFVIAAKNGISVEISENYVNYVSGKRTAIQVEIYKRLA